MPLGRLSREAWRRSHRVSGVNGGGGHSSFSISATPCHTPTRIPQPSPTDERLRDTIAKRMRMSPIIQPLMLMELLGHRSPAPARDIARRILPNGWWAACSPATASPNIPQCLTIRAAIPLRKIKRMKHITAHRFQLHDEGSRQLGIQQDLHAGRISTR